MSFAAQHGINTREITSEVFDLSGIVDIESMGCCPFCDQPLDHGVTLIEADDYMGLAHADCIRDAVIQARGEG